MDIEGIDEVRATSRLRRSPLDHYLSMLQQPDLEDPAATGNPLQLTQNLLQSFGQLLSAIVPLLQLLQQLSAQSQLGNGTGQNVASGLPGSAPIAPSTGGFSTAPTSGQLSPEESKQMAVDVASRLMKDFHLTKEQAAGVVGNLYHESAGMNPNVNEFGSDPNSPTYGRPNDTQFGYGWAQWTGTRKTDYLNFCKENGLDPSSPAANYAMLKHELETSEAETIPKLKEARSPEEAAQVFREVFERATNPVDESRKQAANNVYAWLG